MDTWCRICSRSDEFRRFPLFSVADVSQEVIAKMITSCTDTQVSSEDGLPQQICPDCLITLSLAFSFRRLCRRTDAKFRETFEPRAPSQSAEHMASQPRRSQSQVGDESGVATYDSVPVIKEEVEFYEYECSAPPPPPEDQMSWVIQNPRTIHDGSTAGGGPMTVLHNVGQYQEDGGGGGGEQPEMDDMMSSMVPMVTMEEGGHDPAEYGESSGSGQRKKKHEPERFSKRIRRQSDPSAPLLTRPVQLGYPVKEENKTDPGSSCSYVISAASPVTVIAHKNPERIDLQAKRQIIQLEDRTCARINPNEAGSSAPAQPIPTLDQFRSKLDTMLNDVHTFMAVRATTESRPQSEEDFNECEQIVIKEKQDLMQLEERLGDFVFAAKLLRFYESVFNLSGKREGKDFFRKFMRQTVPASILVGYSWTGQTRRKKEGDVPNQSFQAAFPNFIRFVRKLLLKADFKSTIESTDRAFADYLRQKMTEIRRFGPKTPSDPAVGNVAADQSIDESSASDYDKVPEFHFLESFGNKTLP